MKKKPRKSYSSLIIYVYRDKTCACVCNTAGWCVSHGRRGVWYSKSSRPCYLICLTDSYRQRCVFIFAKIIINSEISSFETFLFYLSHKISLCMLMESFYRHFFNFLAMIRQEPIVIQISVISTSGTNRLFVSHKCVCTYPTYVSVYFSNSAFKGLFSIWLFW